MILLLLPLAFLLMSAESMAQSPVDSMVIMNVNGNRGDTVSMNILFANHSDSVGGFVIMVRYDPMRLQAIDTYPIGRAAFFSTPGNVYRDTIGNGTIRILAYSLVGAAMLPGSDPAVILKFRILPTSPDGYYPVRFDSLSSNDNTWSNRLGSVMIVPQLFNGNVIVGAATNSPPSFTQIPTTPQSVAPQNLLQFTVTASDANNDSVTLSAQNLPTGASFATTRGYRTASTNFTFTPADSQAGRTYVVTFRASDNINPVVTQNVTINVTTGGPSNRAPVILSVGAQTVTEGNHLEFTMRAYDPDGDILTLQASGLPANSSFPTVQGDSVVSGVFSFDPDFSQGPDTIIVSFTARDINNASSQAAVTIYILDAPNDILRIPAGQGALPASLGRTLVIEFVNSKRCYGLQFDIIYDPSTIIIRSATPSPRAEELAFFSQPMAGGRYRIMMFSFGDQSIASGNGPIATLNIDINMNAVPGPHVVTFDSATSVQDSIGTTQDVVFTNGVYTVDRLGDANLDGVINVGDCVAIVASILQRLTFGLRAADAADVDRDGQVRIADLMMLVNMILGRTILSPPLPYIAGNAQLIRDGFSNGQRASLPLWVTLDLQGAGVQFAFDYDPSQIAFHGIAAGSMINGLRLDYEDTGGRIIGIIYDFDLSEFGPGQGNLFELDVESIGDMEEPGRAIRIADFQIVDINAKTLNVQVLGELPLTYELHQNYPNPFNSSTVIQFDIPQAASVRLEIYNLLGQVVRTLYDGYLDAGSHRLIWNGLDDRGVQVTSGIYFYRLQGDGFDKAKRMVLVK